MANYKTFLGFKQVTLDYYNSLSIADKKYHMWLVNEYETVSGGTREIKHSQIYFGTKLYAEVNSSNPSEMAKIQNLINSLGSMVNNDGTFNGIEGFETATNLTDVIEELKNSLEIGGDDIEL